jgi:FMN-dependent oxidoreductase (nitrilotriacetate monooxygenase family)
VFHLGWFVGFGFGVQSFGRTWTGVDARDWMKPDLHVDLVRSMERAGMDYVMYEDSSCIPDTYGGNSESVLRNAHGAPKSDPMTLVPLLAQATQHLGIVATAATAFYPPYLLARLMGSLDHLSDGRVGVNLVTASSNRAAQNYGLDQHHEHDERYAMADEWVDVVTKLWDSWERDAVVLDPGHETGKRVFADHTKVHRIDHQGKYYSVRGPLQTTSSPQQRPVICQAGGSPAGRAFAAKWADTVITGVRGVDKMAAYRADIRERAVTEGRDPDDVKVMYLVSPVLGETQAEAEEKAARIHQQRLDEAEWALESMSYASGVDFSQFALDEELPEISTNGHQSTIAEFARNARGKTLREAVSYRQVESVPLVGTPARVAEEMGELFTATGGDGFLFGNEIDRRTIAELCDGLVPELQKRGLTRTEYTGPTFRDNLRAF